jgi:DNA-binding NarL/FixJ family response regulator
MTAGHQIEHTKRAASFEQGIRRVTNGPAGANRTDTESIRVLLADDHPIFREGVRSLLLQSGQFTVVGEAMNGNEAVLAASALDPDVVVMDLQMPELSGIDATRAIMAADPRTAVLILTMYEDDTSVFAAMRAGARGYLLKSADPAKMTRAIASVADGDAIFSPGIADRVLAYFSDAQAAEPNPSTFPELTEREREVLHLIAAGRNNQAIARQLYISPKTVRNHVSSIFAKLQVADRAEAIVRSREAGFGER